MNTKTYFSLICLAEAGGGLCSTQRHTLMAGVGFYSYVIWNTLPFWLPQRGREPGELCRGSNLSLTIPSTCWIVLAAWPHVSPHVLRNVEKNLEYLMSITIFATHELLHLRPSKQRLRTSSTWLWNFTLLFTLLLGFPCQVTVENSSFMLTLLPQSLLEVTYHTSTDSSCCNPGGDSALTAYV